jgi:hypothetical protein
LGEGALVTAAWLARFAAEALAALQEREPDPIEDAERAAVFGPQQTPRTTPKGSRNDR